MKRFASVPPMEVLYTASARSSGGRNGRAHSADSQLELQLASPPGLGGPPHALGVTNPEELLAMGWSACFLTALSVLARRQRLSPDRFEIAARVMLGRESDGTFRLAAELDGRLPGVEREQARALMRSTHELCPYSAATRGNIDVLLLVDGHPCHSAE